MTPQPTRAEVRTSATDATTGASLKEEAKSGSRPSSFMTFRTVEAHTAARTKSFPLVKPARRRSVALDR
jgi:hypothetical protein